MYVCKAKKNTFTVKVTSLGSRSSYVNDIFLESFLKILKKNVFVREVLEEDGIGNSGLFTFVQISLHEIRVFLS